MRQRSERGERSRRRKPMSIVAAFNRQRTDDQMRKAMQSAMAL
jgi:hypothetical protein